MEMEEHWEICQNEASVSLPLPAQRSPAPSDNFFQRVGESNNNILSSNPFDQRRPTPARIWFASLSSLLRPDILPPMTSPVSVPASAPVLTQAPEIVPGLADFPFFSSYPPPSGLLAGLCSPHITRRVFDAPPNLTYPKIMIGGRRRLLLPSSVRTPG